MLAKPLCMQADEATRRKIGGIHGPQHQLACHIIVPAQQVPQHIGRAQQGCHPAMAQNPQKACQRKRAIAEELQRNGPQRAVHGAFHGLAREYARQAGGRSHQGQVACKLQHTGRSQKRWCRQRGEGKTKDEDAHQHRAAQSRPEPQHPFPQEGQETRLPHPAKCDQIAADDKERHHRHAAKPSPVQPLVADPGRCRDTRDRIVVRNDDRPCGE
ncbi:hypothetical protein D3C72_1028910 [compost metagenome]